MVTVFSKNKRSQTLFRRDPSVSPPPDIFFNGSIRLADAPLEVTIPAMGLVVSQLELAYEILPDPDAEITASISITPFICGDE